MNKCGGQKVVKSFLKILFFLIFIIVLLGIYFKFQCSALALDLVYPKKNNMSVNAKSTYLIGNIGSNKYLKINGTDVKTYKGGAFVYVAALDFGENNFEISSIGDNGKETKVLYVIKRPPKNKSVLGKNKDDSDSKIELFNDFICARVTKDGSPLRLKADVNSNRVAHLLKDTSLFLDASMGDYYRVYIDKNTKYWIKKNYFAEDSHVSEPLKYRIRDFKYSKDKEYEYFAFHLGEVLPYVIRETESGLDIKIFYVENIPVGLQEVASNLNLSNNVLSFSLPYEKLWGYDFVYKNSKMILKVRQPIKADTHYPLKNIVVALDPGHGGVESGAVGPTKIKESDIVLDIAQKVKKILIKEGAKPFLTRNSDKTMDLYDRVQLIKKRNALFSISIHANALPDGNNPYEKYGTSVYYYYPEAKEFADILKRRIINNIKTRDDGTNYASYVLTRVSSSLSVLIEVAYMINPEDYEKLTDENFRQDIAQGIVDGMKEYMNSSIPK